MTKKKYVLLFDPEKKKYFLLPNWGSLFFMEYYKDSEKLVDLTDDLMDVEAELNK